MSDRDPEQTGSEEREHRPAVNPPRHTEEREREPDDHQGATETEVADVTPPARGPASPAKRTKKGDEIDPTDDLTPG